MVEIVVEVTHDEEVIGFWTEIQKVSGTADDRCVATIARQRTTASLCCFGCADRMRPKSAERALVT
jgi:hypothetical protein